MSELKDWSDDVLQGVHNTVNLLNFMLRERSQLYGTIIYLMQLLETEKVIMPPAPARLEYQNSFFVLFDKDPETDEFFVYLKPRETVEEEDNGNQD